MITKLKYAHLLLGEDVEAFAGYYTPEKKLRLGALEETISNEYLAEFKEQGRNFYTY